LKPPAALSISSHWNKNTCAEKEKAIVEAEAKEAMAPSKLSADMIRAGKLLVSQRISIKVVLGM